MIKKVIKGVSLASLAFLAALLTAGCALEAGQGEESAPDTTVSKDSELAKAGPSHCVLDLATNSTKCYETFPLAISAATGGRLTNAPADPPAALSDKKFNARIEALAAGPTPFATQVVGIFYKDQNFQGATLSITSGGNCTSTLDDTDFTVASMPSGWNDVISSFRCYANCYCKIYENINFGGASYGYFPSSTFVGSAMNDRTSSITFS